MEISKDLEKCLACLDFVEPTTLKLDQKPYVIFDVEKLWKPKNKVKILFIAESPPCNGKQRYFYNPQETEERTNLRKEILSRLKLDRLEDFKSRDYFLIDTIKCRLCKPILKKTLHKIADNCSQRFLSKEIDEMKPDTIFVLGDTAKYGLQKLAGFEELRHHKITDDFEKRLAGYRVILSPYPSGQTRQYNPEISQAFRKIRMR